MWDKILNLTTPEGRAVYRLVNVLVPQSVVGLLFLFINDIKDLPLDGDYQTVASVAIGAFVTSYFKYARDTKA